MSNFIHPKIEEQELRGSVLPSAAPRSLEDCRFEVLGVSLAAVEIEDLIRHMEAWIAARQGPKIMVFANVHVVTEAQQDPSFKELLNSAVTVPDGKPLVWLARRSGLKLKRRVYGPDVMLEFCRATGSKYRTFLYGATPETLKDLTARLERDFATKVVGAYAPPFRPLTEDEDREVVRMINDSKPDVLWIGLGCPKQEKWARAHLDRLNVPILGAVGQAFDIHSLRVAAAPRWMQDNGLEWFYRLVTDPRRLWRRYLIGNTRFIYLVLRDSLRARK